MKRSLKVLSLGIVLVMVLSLMLAGCGSGETNTDDTKTSVTASTEVTQTEVAPTESPTAKLVELNWYYTGFPQGDQDIVFAELNKTIKEKINATVKFNLIDFGSWENKAKLLINSQEPYDLIWTSNWSNNYALNVATGAFQPLDELLDKYAPNLKASVPEKVWNAVKVDGKIYGAVNYQTVTSTEGVMFKKELVDKYKFDINGIKKFQDFTPIFETIKKNEKGKYGCLGFGFAEVSKYYGYEIVNSAAAVKLSDDSLKLVNYYETPEFKELLSLNREWYKKGYIPLSAGTMIDFIAEIKSGKYLCAIEGNHKPGGDADNQGRYGFPATSIQISQPLLTAGNATATLTAISKTSNNPERAMMLLELMNTDKKLFNTMVFGIDRTHFTKVSDNAIEPIKDSKYNNSGFAWMYGNQFNAYTLPGQDADVWEQTKKLNEESKPSNVLGFTFNPEAVKTEAANIDALQREYGPIFSSGAKDPEKVLPEFLEKMEKAGLQKVIDETQKQLDTWKASKK